MKRLLIGIAVVFFLHSVSLVDALAVQAVAAGEDVDAGIDPDADLELPTPDFAADIQEGFAPLAVEFENLSSGVITSYSWDFGDGHTSDEWEPTHTYDVPGSYAVSLTVFKYSNPVTETKVNYITATPPLPPSADFGVSKTAGTAPLSLRFTNQSTGTITSWHWDFGDGETSTHKYPYVHTYSAPGSYTISLTVSGPLGSDTVIRENYLVVYPPLKGDFSAGRTTGIAPLTVSFADQSTGMITSWQWDFGDGYDSKLQNPEHTYETPGIYTVSLVVSDPLGDNHTIQTNCITVAHPGADINRDTKVDLADLVTVMQILTAQKAPSQQFGNSDVNGDNKIGLEETAYLLKFVGEISK